MNGEAAGRAGKGEDPQYPLVRRGEHQIAPGAPGAPAAAGQRSQASAVDELKVREVDDDPRLARCESLEGSRDACGVYNVKLPVQRDDDMAAAFSGAQVHAEHKPAFLPFIAWSRRRSRTRATSAEVPRYTGALVPNRALRPAG
jgi:hypothetical protein